MSKARLALLALALSVGGARAAAQAPDIAAIEDSVAALKARSNESQLALAAAEARARGVPDDSLVLSGSVLLFTAADVPAAERERLTRAFATVSARLRAALGPEGPTLLTETRWQLVVTPRDRRFSQPMVTLVRLVPDDSARLSNTSVGLAFPLPEDVLAQLVLDAAGAQLLAKHPALTAWIGPSILMAAPADAYYFASRELTLRGTTRSRRCVRGALEDCLVILDPARRDEWYTAEDDPHAGVPASTGVRASVLLFTVATAGPRLLPALASAPDSTPPLTLLAQAAGLTPETLVTQWQTAVADGGRSRARVAPGLALSSVAWLCLFGFVATRRRPR